MNILLLFVKFHFSLNETRKSLISVNFQTLIDIYIFESSMMFTSSFLILVRKKMSIENLSFLPSSPLPSFRSLFSLCFPRNHYESNRHESYDFDGQVEIGSLPRLKSHHVSNLWLAYSDAFVRVKIDAKNVFALENGYYIIEQLREWISFGEINEQFQDSLIVDKLFPLLFRDVWRRDTGFFDPFRD